MYGIIASVCDTILRLSVSRTFLCVYYTSVSIYDNCLCNPVTQKVTSAPKLARPLHSLVCCMMHTINLVVLLRGNNLRAKREMGILRYTRLWLHPSHDIFNYSAIYWESAVIVACALSSTVLRVSEQRTTPLTISAMIGFNVLLLFLYRCIEYCAGTT